MKTSTQIQIVLSPWDLTDDYNRHVGVALVSLLEHSSQPITIHLLYDEKLCLGKETETKYNKECYQKIADKYQCGLEFHHVELPNWVYDIKMIKNGIWTVGIFLRLNLPELLLDIDKIIYIDCDTIVLTDISKLWDINLNGKYLAATIDQGIPSWKKSSKYYLKKRNISLPNYFNSGVLVLNLQELRKIEFTKKVWEYLWNNKDTPYPDQDAMNYVCQKNFIELEWKYDNITHLKEVNEDCIMHLCGGPKPWNLYTHPYNDFYWNYLRNTPWCEDMDEYYRYRRLVPDIPRTLPALERDFFACISGTKWQKIQYAFHFVLCIFKSFVAGIRNRL